MHCSIGIENLLLLLRQNPSRMSFDDHDQKKKTEELLHSGKPSPLEMMLEFYEKKNQESNDSRQHSTMLGRGSSFGPFDLEPTPIHPDLDLASKLSHANIGPRKTVVSSSSSPPSSSFSFDRNTTQHQTSLPTSELNATASLPFLPTVGSSPMAPFQQEHPANNPSHKKIQKFAPSHDTSSPASNNLACSFYSESNEEPKSMAPSVESGASLPSSSNDRVEPWSIRQQGSTRLHSGPPHLQENLSLGVEVRPSPQDVICAKGRNFHDLPGCRKFREVIRAFIPQYAAAKSRWEKSMVINAVIDHVIIAQRGRFLKYHHHPNRSFHLVDPRDGQIRHKVGHALREAMPGFLKEQNQEKEQNRTENESE